MSSSQPRIAIVGGGPAGLTAGVLLHKCGVPFTIFELRSEPTAEEIAQPSGMLDLHEESGLAAIRECGLFEEFMPLTGDCAQVGKLMDKDGNVLLPETPFGENRPEISRHALNQLLISRLPAEKIKWGHKLVSATSFTRSGQAETELDFGENGKQTFDLVIGADGAWSRVRTLLTDVKPQYAGRQVITLTIRHITTKYTHLAKLIGPGSFFVLGNRHGVTSQQGPQDSARLYIFLTTADEDFAVASGFGSETAASAKNKLLGDDTLFGQWAPAIKELISVACDEEAADHPGTTLDIRPLCGFLPGHTWETKTGATLIGDAAHLMPPSGEGVNDAMLDSLLLSRAVSKAYEATVQDDVSFLSALDPLMRAFEVEVATRAQAKAEESYTMQNIMFSEDGATAMSEMFKGFGANGEGGRHD